jgi:hypothetical protein
MQNTNIVIEWTRRRRTKAPSKELNKHLGLGTPSTGTAFGVAPSYGQYTENL